MITNRRELAEQERVQAEIERGDRRDNIGSALKVLAFVYFFAAPFVLKYLDFAWQPAFWLTLGPFFVIFCIAIYFQTY